MCLFAIHGNNINRLSTKKILNENIFIIFAHEHDHFYDRSV